MSAVNTSDSATTLTFIDPLPGLGDLTGFTLSQIDDEGLLFTLRSVEAPDTRLFLLDPRPFFPGYRPELDPETLARLDLGDAAPTVLVVVRPASGDSPHTANLLAPVVVNPRTGAAIQLVLDGADWPLRAPLAAT